MKIGFYAIIWSKISETVLYHFITCITIKYRAIGLPTKVVRNKASPLCTNSN